CVAAEAVKKRDVGGCVTQASARAALAATWAIIFRPYGPLGNGSLRSQVEFPSERKGFYFLNRKNSFVPIALVTVYWRFRITGAWVTAVQVVSRAAVRSRM